MHVHNDTKVVHPVSVMTRTLASYVSLFLVSVFFAVITSKLTSSSLSASTPTLQVPNPLRRLRHHKCSTRAIGHRCCTTHCSATRISGRRRPQNPPVLRCRHLLRGSWCVSKPRIETCLKGGERRGARERPPHVGAPGARAPPPSRGRDTQRARIGVSPDSKGR